MNARQLIHWAFTEETKRMMLSIALAYEGLAEREEERRRKE